MSARAQAVRTRVEQIVIARYGRLEESLLLSGLVDSLRVVELAVVLAKEFDVDVDAFGLEDMATITAITNCILRQKSK